MVPAIALGVWCLHTVTTIGTQRQTASLGSSPRPGQRASEASSEVLCSLVPRLFLTLALQPVPECRQLSPQTRGERAAPVHSQDSQIARAQDVPEFLFFMLFGCIGLLFFTGTISSVAS